MTKIKTIVLFTAGALSVAGLGLTVGHLRRSRVVHMSPPTAIHDGFSARAGRQHRYEVKLETGLRFAAKNPGAVATTTLQGDWTVTVSSASSLGSDVACELQHPHLSGVGFGEADSADVAAMEKRLAQRFWVSYQADGAATRLHFPKDMQDDVRNMLTLIVTESQLVQPASRPPQWTATERDGAGAYLAIYNAAGLGEIIKKKTRYIDSDAQLDGKAAGLEIGVLDSDVRFTIDTQGDLDKVEGHEASNIQAQPGVPGLSVDIRIRLDNRRDSKAVDLVGSLERARSGLVTVPIVTQRPSEEEALSRADAQATHGKTFKAISQSFNGGTIDEQSQSLLEAWLRRHPTDIPEAVGLARADSPAGHVSEAIFVALGSAGTPETQAALCAIARDQNAPTRLRVEAMKGLVRTRHPMESTVSALVDLFDDRGDPEIRRHALYVGAGVGSNILATHPDQALRVESRLISGYEKSIDPSRVDWMIALGNLGTPGAVPTIERGLHDPDAVVRAEAARALRLIQDPSAERLIESTLDTDVAGPVRAAAVFAAGFRPIDPLVEALAKAVENDKADYVRVDAIALLSKHFDASPRIKQALTSAATKDPKSSVRRLAREALESASRGG